MPRNDRIASRAFFTSRRSIKALLRGAARGDQDSFAALWSEYSPRLERTFRHWLRHSPRRVADEEDLTVDAMSCICRRAQAGAYARVTTRAEFWIAVRRVAWHTFVGLRRRERCLKRGGSWQSVDIDLHAIPAPPPVNDDYAAVEKEIYDFLRLIHFRHPLFWLLFQLRDGGLSVTEASQTLRISRQASHAQVRLMRRMWLEYADLGDAARRARFKAEEPLRRKMFEEALAERNRDIAARERGELPQLASVPVADVRKALPVAVREARLGEVI